MYAPMQNVNSYMICMAFYIYYYYGVGTTLPLTTACIHVRSTITYDTSVCTPYILLYFVIQQNIVLMQHVGTSSDTARGHSLSPTQDGYS